MLSDRDSELLTAFLDGQLGARQRKTALRLLQRSAEARELLRQLQRDAEALRGLPRHALPADFAARVLSAAAARGVRPDAAGVPLRPRRLPAWAGLAAAAAVLLAVAVGSFLYFDRTRPLPDAVALGPVDVPKPDWSGAPTPKVSPKSVRPPAPGFRLALADLGQEAKRARLTKELHRRPAHYLALNTGNNARTLERLSEAFRASGVQLVVDSRARPGLDRKQPGGRYVVYAENLRPEELTAILHRLGQRVGQDKAGQGGPTRDHLTVKALAGADRNHLAKLLGVRPGQLQLPKGPVELREPPIFVPHDPRDKGAKGAAPPPPAAPDRLALVLAYDGHGSAAASPEVRRFLSGRRRHHSGTVQVYFVLHEVRA